MRLYNNKNPEMYKPEATSRLICIGENEFVAIELIKMCKRRGLSTEILLWGESMSRHIEDEDMSLLNSIRGNSKI